MCTVQFLSFENEDVYRPLVFSFILLGKLKKGNESGRQEMEEREKIKYNPTNFTLFTVWFKILVL